MGVARMRRVDEAIRQVIADAVSGEIKDPRVGFVTITDVKTTPDLRSARVYLTVLGSETKRTLALDGLRSANGYLQTRLSAQLHLKRTPTLDFIYDETTDKAMRVEEILQRVAPHALAPEGESQ
jgi:ribosome-binding factor A